MPRKKKLPKYYQGLGRRKRSTATARLFEGEGELLVNDTPIDEFFKSKTASSEYLSPFETTSTQGKFYGTIKVSGGGMSGQLGAVRHAISRALLAYDESHRPSLRKKGLLTRDPREKERKKYNLHKARRAHQFSKR